MRSWVGLLLFALASVVPLAAHADDGASQTLTLKYSATEKVFSDDGPPTRDKIDPGKDFWVIVSGVKHTKHLSVEGVCAVVDATGQNVTSQPIEGKLIEGTKPPKFRMRMPAGNIVNYQLTFKQSGKLLGRAVQIGPNAPAPPQTPMASTISFLPTREDYQKFQKDHPNGFLDSVPLFNKPLARDNVCLVFDYLTRQLSFREGGQKQEGKREARALSSNAADAKASSNSANVTSDITAPAAGQPVGSSAADTSKTTRDANGNTSQLGRVPNPSTSTNRMKMGRNENDRAETPARDTPMLYAPNDGFVTFVVTNINPFVSDVTIGHEEFNYRVAPPSTFLEGKSIPEAGKVQSATPEGPRTMAMWATLANELGSFYALKSSDRQPSVELFDMEMGVIRTKISQSMQIEPVTATSLLAAGKQDLASSGLKEEALKKPEADVAKACELFGKLENVRYYVVSGPVQVRNEDALQMNLTITESGKTMMSESYRLFVRGGWKWDFSGGLVISGLTDDKYFTVADSVPPDSSAHTKKKTTKNRIVKEDTGSFSAGVGAIAHFVYRTPNVASFGFALGALINTQTNIQYLIGGSVLLGREQRFVLNSGMSIGKVKRLRADLTGKTYWDQTGPVPTSDSTELGWYVGLTYNPASTSTSPTK